jgi:hypothetical protein
MRKLDGANGTKALEKADELQRPETVAKQQNDGRKISNKSSNKSSLQQEYKKGRKAALAWKKEVISSSFPHKSFFQKARAPKAVKVCF